MLIQSPVDVFTGLVKSFSNLGLQLHDYVLVFCCRTPRADIWLHQASNAWQTSSPSKPLRLQKVYLDFSVSRNAKKTWTQSMNIHWLYIGWVMFQPVQARHSSGRQKQSMLLQPSSGDFGCWKLVARRNMWNPWNSRSRPEVFSPLCSSLKFLFCLFFNAHYNMIFMLFIQVCCCFDCFTLLYYHILVSYNSEATWFSAICALSDETGPTFKIPTRLELGKASWSGSS